MKVPSEGQAKRQKASEESTKAKEDCRRLGNITREPDYDGGGIGGMGEK